MDSANTAPSALVIEGDPGIGKTTLWFSALEQARERGFAVVAARAAATDSVLAYTALADLLADTGVDWTQLPDPQRLAIDRILLRANTDGQPIVQRTVAAAFVTAIHILAEVSPVLVAVDDLQWLDPSSAHAIGFAARRATGHVGWLVTFRTNSSLDRAPSWFAPPPPAELTRIRLGPLSVSALHAAVSQRLGRSLSRPQMSRVYEVSAGNPFYAIELARTLLDQPPGAQMSLPATLMELVHNRVGTLDPTVRDALLAVACIGAPNIGDIAYAIGRDAHHVVALLEDAETKGIVDISGNRVQFTHPLLARGCYDDATAAQRRAMHRRLAELVTEPELRARHLALSDPTGEPQTLSALDTAAEIARSRGAPAAAAELMDLAIGLGADSAECRIRSAAFHFDAGDPARARLVLNEALESLSAGPLRAAARRMLGLIATLNDSFNEAVGLLDEALADADADDFAFRAPVLVMLSFALFNAGRGEEALHRVRQAVDEASRLGDTQPLSWALGMSAMVGFMAGRGLDQPGIRKAVELDNRRADISVAFWPIVQDALLSAWTGQLEHAHEQMLSVRRDCLQKGEESELTFIDFHTVLIETWRGSFATAALVAEDATERALQLGGDLPLSLAATNRAVLAAYAGRENATRREVSDALAASARCGSHRLGEWPRTMLGFLEVSMGRYEAAVRTLEPLLARLTAAPGETEIIAASFVPDAAEALMGLGRLDEAEPLIAALEHNGRRMDRAWMLAVGARCRAMLLAAQGDLTAATAAAQTAMAEHDRLPMPFERARSQLLLGQLQHRQRSREVATANVSAALAVFDELDIPLWSARARESLARSDVKPGPAKLLTAGEQQVAEHVASGMSNRDVAAALFISPKTVEVHLTRIYRKLGLRTRSELIRRGTQLLN